MMALSRSTRDEDSLIVGLIGVAIQRTSWELAAELVSDASTDLETLESACKHFVSAARERDDLDLDSLALGEGPRKFIAQVLLQAQPGCVVSGPRATPR